MSRSSSTTSLRSRESTFTRAPKKPLWDQSNHDATGGSKKVTEKGDAGSGVCEAVKGSLLRLSSQKEQTFVRRQRSDPVLARAATAKDVAAPVTVETGECPPPSVTESASVESVTVAGIDNATVSPPKAPGTPDEERVCEGLKKDPKLRSLCTAIGLSLHPDTLVGPIEKGQLIIGVLQDSLNDLIKLKVRAAEKKGKLFHIQQSGLDAAIRALENADRSLKTMKAIKEPILGRKARSQQSIESVGDPSLQKQQQAHLHQKQTEAVIRILSTTKEKFDKMGNGLDKFMTGLTFLAPRTGTSTSTLPSSTGLQSRRTTGISLLTTPVTPLNTATGSTRVRSSTSATSVGSRNGNKEKMSSILF